MGAAQTHTRLAMTAAGILILLWSGIEDRDVLTVTALGCSLSLTASLFYARAHFTRRTLWHSALTGAAAGALSNIATVLLMLFKNLHHAHVFPDYPPALMLAMLERLPLWTLAGSLAGLGLCLLLKALAQHNPRITGKNPD